MSEFVAIPSVTALCYLTAELYKAIAPESLYKHIPVLCGVAGAVLGMACYLWLPGYIPAENAIVAAAIGVSSGWAATGANQTIRQERQG